MSDQLYCNKCEQWGDHLPETAECPKHREPVPFPTLYLLIGEVLGEIDRATESFPTWPTDPLHAFSVVGEEYGECLRELLQLTYEPHKATKAEARKEAVQLAAMALRFLMSFDHYEFTGGPQHSQSRSSGCALCDRGDGQLGHADDCPNG